MNGFELTKKALNGILDRLDKEIQVQFGKRKSGMDMKNIQDILAQIDEEIVSDTYVSEQMISGEPGARATIKAEIARVQQEAKKMIEGLLSRAQTDADKDALKGVIKDNVDGLKSVKTQAELDKLESEDKQFTQKNDRTRYQEYETRIKELNTRIAKAKEYKNNVGAVPKEDMEDDYVKLDEALAKYQNEIKGAGELPKGTDIKKRYQYFVGVPSRRADEQNRKELKILLDSLESLKGNDNDDIAKLLTELKGQIELTDDKKGIKSIKDLSKIKRILQNSECAKFNWDKVCEDTRKTKRTDAVKDLKAVMENSKLLKLDPDKRKGFLDRIAGLDLSKPDIHAELDKLATDVGAHINEGIKDIEQTAKDAAKIEDLREERADLRDARYGLEGKNSDVKAEKVESTKKITIYGKEFDKIPIRQRKSNGELGEPEEVDFVELFSSTDTKDKAKQEAALNVIVNKLITRSDKGLKFPDGLDEAYNREGDKPNMGRIAAWLHKRRTGETPEETAKKNFLKKQIRGEIKTLIGKDAAYKGSTRNCGELTPEELAKFNEGARRAVVEQGKSAEDAHKDAQKDVDKAQQDKDANDER